jgi:SAM-dependent methyltransferase
LDFASGYGSVARHLPNVAPTLHLSACDIHPQAVSFLKDVLSIDAFQSDTDPKRLELPKFDVVFALSFFSHLPKRTFAGWLEALFAAVNPGGVLIFTTHGEYAHKKVLAYIKTLIVDDEQFGFVPGSEQRDLNRDDYGVTVCYPPFVISRLQQIPGVRLAQFSESDWWNVQDTYACIKSYS